MTRHLGAADGGGVAATRRAGADDPARRTPTLGESTSDDSAGDSRGHDGDSRSTARRALTPLQWLICAVAAIGFAFDTYELLMLPLIVRPALAELLGVAPNSLEVNEWVGMTASTSRPSAAASSACSAAISPTSSAGAACWSGASCSTASPRSRRHTRRPSNGCCSGAAARSSASASSSSPPSPGCRSCSPTRSSARRCSATRRRSARSAACMVTGAYYLIVTYGASLPGRCAAGMRRGATR